MPFYRIDPIPDMECQYRGPGGFIPDLTCGRYCLKSLLKYWHQKAGRGRITRLEIPPPKNKQAYWVQNQIANWVGYDFWTDYEHAQDLMWQADRPADAAAWLKLIREVGGPLLLTGPGIGGAYKGMWPIPAVGHVILLIGVNTDHPASLEYLDPLVGNLMRAETLAAMDGHIDDKVTCTKPGMVRKITMPGQTYYTPG